MAFGANKPTDRDLSAGGHGEACAFDLLESVLLRIGAVLPLRLVHVPVGAPSHLSFEG